MDYRTAIDVFNKILKKYPLSSEEKEAVSTAIGLLDWGAIGKNRVKRIFKNMRDKKNDRI